MVQYCLLKVIVSEKLKINQVESTNRVLEGSKIWVKMMKLAGIVYPQLMACVCEREPTI